MSRLDSARQVGENGKYIHEIVLNKVYCMQNKEYEIMCVNENTENSVFDVLWSILKKKHFPSSFDASSLSTYSREIVISIFPLKYKY